MKGLKKSVAKLLKGPSNSPSALARLREAPKMLHEIRSNFAGITKHMTDLTRGHGSERCRKSAKID